MELPRYSSVAAFIAHWRALNRESSAPLKGEEAARLADMDRIIGALRPEERAALETASQDTAAAHASALRRHRERAEIDLARAPRKNGLLQD